MKPTNDGVGSERVRVCLRLRLGLAVPLETRLVCCPVGRNDKLPCIEIDCYIVTDKRRPMPNASHAAAARWIFR